MTVSSTGDTTADIAAPQAAIVPLVLLSAVGLAAAGVPEPVRAVCVATFVLVGPGWAVLAAWNLVAGPLGVALAVATSIALAVCLAVLQLYTGTWSPIATFLGLISITVGGVVTTLVRARRAGVR